MIEINNLNMVYDDKSHVINDMKVNFPNTGLVCIMGDSGCGKTTLLNCIYNNTPFTGSVIVDGINVQSAEYARAKKNIVSMVYQDYRLLENLTVEQNIRVSCEVAGDVFTQEYLNSLLHKVGLASCLAKRKCKKLSGGEKQRVAIARALAQKSKIILADEPTGNLDSKNASKIFQLFKSLSSEILIIIVTHSHRLADAYADYQVKLCDGAIIENTIEENCHIMKDEDNLSCAQNDDVAVSQQKKGTLSDKNIKLSCRLSAKSNLAIIALPYKNKSVLVAMTIFLIVFMLIACVLGSMVSINQTSILTKNAKSKNESIMKLSNNVRQLKNDFLENAGLERACYSFKNEDYINQNIPLTDDQYLDANFMKFNDTFESQNFIECNDIGSIGGTLLCGKNVSEYNEIVINEALAYYLLTVGALDNKQISNYMDLLGCSLGEFVINGIMDAQYSRIADKYSNLTRREFIDLTEEEQEKAKSAKSILDENNTTNSHIIKVGYSEHMRNTYQSINTNTKKIALTLYDKLNRFIIEYESKYTVEYIDYNGAKITASLQDNEIVIPKKYINKLAPQGNFIQPFELGISIVEAVDMMVVGYVTEEKVYVSSSFEQGQRNQNKNIFEAINFSSKDNIQDVISSFESELEKYNISSWEENNFLVIQAAFTTGIDSVETFFQSFNEMFMGVFFVFCVIALLFGVTLVYLLISRIRAEISVLKNIGFENKRILQAMLVSMSLIWVFAVIAILGLYFAICSIFNAFFTAIAFALFKTMFVNFFVWIALSVLLIVAMLSSVLLINKIK